MRDDPLSDALLEWYDSNARVLPWRVAPAAHRLGGQADPYRIWMSEIMLQQTTVAAVKSYFEEFTSRWPTVVDLAKAEDADVMAAWAGLGYYARARNLLKCARIVASDFEGQFPSTEAALLKLPGIGPYTAAAIASIAFDQRAVVVDGNVERVVSRLFAIKDPLPGSKPVIREKADLLTPDLRPGDYAQAMMDLGATVCTPRNPKCALCPVSPRCKACAAGIAPDLPAKTPKAPKPVRYGTVYIARVGNTPLLERRAEAGLLGGMLGWPGSPWVESAEPPLADDAHAPLNAQWRRLNGEVRHTFTHFHLRLSVCVASLDSDAWPATGAFVRIEEFSSADLPTVMRKAYDLAQPHLGEF